jgi:hypothetical protein
MMAVSPSVKPMDQGMDVKWYSGIGESLLDAPQHVFNVVTSAGVDVAKQSEILDFVDRNFTDGSIDKWLGEAKQNRISAMKDSRADPKTYGAVAQGIHGIATILPVGIAGFAAGGPVGSVSAVGGFTGYDKYYDLRDQGVDHDTALKGAGITGVVMGLSAALAPYYGQKLATQVATAVGMNVGAGMTERAGIGSVLEANGYDKVAEHYKTIDGTAMTADAILALGFVGLGRYAKSRRVVPNEAIDDAMAGIMATRERTTGGEIPTSPQAFDSEAARLASVTEQMMDGTPLHQIVTDPPHPDTTVNPKIGEDTIAGAKAMVEFTENAGKTIDVIDEVSTASQIIAEMDAPARAAVEPTVEVVTQKVGADTTAKLEGLDPWITPKTFEEKLYEFKNALLDLQQQFGWAEVGGKLLRQQEAGDLGLGSGEVLGRTQWLPKADWWPGKPKSLTEKTGNDLVQKVLEGKTLTKADKANLEFLVGIMREQKKQKALGIEGKADEARPDAELETGMVERLAKIDEGLVESLATRFEDTDAFMKEVKKALDEFDAKQEEFKLTGQTEAEIRAAEAARVKTEAEAKAKANAPSPDAFMLTGSNRAADVGAAAGQKSMFDVTPESLDRARSEAILDQTPDMTIRLAPDQDVNAKEYLAKMDEEIRLAEADAPLYKVAVACALGRNAE